MASIEIVAIKVEAAARNKYLACLRINGNNRASSSLLLFELPIKIAQPRQLSVASCS
jgi:hypothetical protein